MKKRKPILNNNGSTLVLALLAVAFVMVLGTVIMSMSMTSLKMKRIDSASKKTFYSAESAVDEIYTGLGTDALSLMSKSYEKVITTMVSSTTGGSLVIDNAQANEAFRNNYMMYLLEMLSQGALVVPNNETYVESVDFNILSKVVETLNSYINYKENAKVESALKIQLSLDDDRIVITDCRISYLNEETGYFANVVVDIEFVFPDMNVTFTNKGTSEITTFLDYALIADTSIYVGDANYNILGEYNINSSIYAGDKGINVVSGSTADINNILMVTEGNLSVTGGANAYSKINVVGTRLWCDNITINKKTSTIAEVDTQIGAVVNIDSNSSSYVRDDIELNGYYSEANVSGNYYGYSYTGDATGDDETSSSAIINGRYSTLNFSNLTELMLSGRAFINFDTLSAQSYVTGETISVKGNQEAYLVPDEYIKKISGQLSPNPMTIEQWNALGTDKVDSDKLKAEFFATDLLSGDGYVAKEVKGLIYVYLEFSTKANSVNYFKALVNDTYYWSMFNANGLAERNAIRDILVNSMQKLMDSDYSDGSINIKNSGNIYSGGAIYQVKAGSWLPSLIDASDIDDEIRIKSKTFNNKFSLLKHMLLDASNVDVMTTIPATVTTTRGQVTIPSDYASTSAIEKVLNINAIRALETPYNPETYDDSYAIVSNTSVTIPANIDHGVVVVTDGNVYLDHSFSGLIITTGSIQLTGEGSVDNNYDVDSLLLSDKTLANFFNAYKKSNTNTGGTVVSDISNLKVTDLISLNNWRKE